MNLKGRDFLKLLDYTSEEMEYLINLAADLKKKKKNGIPIAHQTIPRLPAQDASTIILVKTGLWSLSILSITFLSIALILQIINYISQMKTH